MESIAVKDKTITNWSYYVTKAYGIHAYLYESNNELKTRSIYVNDTKFEDAKSVYDYFVDLTKDFTKETLVVYTFDIEDIWFAMHDYMENESLGYKVCYMLKYTNEKMRYRVEIRAINGYVDGYEAAKAELNIDDMEAMVAKKYAQLLYDHYFIPERKWYISPYQRTRKQLDKATDNSIITNWPLWPDYKHLRCDVFRGGSCFIHFPALRKQGKYMYLDRTSAYPAELMLNVFPMGKWQSANAEKWYEYTNVAWYGHFTIEFEANYKYLYLLNVYGLDTLNFKADLWINNVDMQILSKFLTLKIVQCDYLRTCEVDFLPRYFIDFICDYYCEKVKAKKEKKSKAIITQKKREVNSIYGDLILNKTTLNDYRKLSRATRPEWGIWCTSYERLALLNLASEVEYVLYGDTDSVFCKYSDQTLAALNTYNQKIDKDIRFLCERMNYDEEKYDMLKELGTFKIECIVKDFIAYKTKQYGYVDENDVEHIKCSGYKRGTITYEMLLQNKLPKCTIDIKYSEDGKVKVQKVEYDEAHIIVALAKNAIKK